MNCQNKWRSKPCAWIEGETTVKNLITDIANKLVSAEIPSPDGGSEVSKWKILYNEREHNYVTYEPYNTNVRGKYIHEDGKVYDVKKISDYTDDSFKDSMGYINEITNEAPYNKSDYSGYYTGKRVNVEGFNYGGSYYEIPNALVVLVDIQPDKREKDLENPWEKYQAYLVKHSRESYYEGDLEDKEWNNFKIVAPMPDDWTYTLWKGGLVYSRYTKTNVYGEVSHYDRSIGFSIYYVNHTKFRTTYYEVSEKLVLQCNADDGTNYNIYFEKPLDSNNYIKLQYGIDIKYQKNLVGYPEKSYLNACDLDTVGRGKTPEIIDELEAYKAFERQMKEEYKRGELELGGVVSPISYWFFSENSTKKWLNPNMRGRDSVIRYWISFNNNRALIILEGDPNFEFESYYISFGYIGKFNTLNEQDTENNFAVTVGMGASDKNKTGFTYEDINKESNLNYAQYGRFTSNGMDTVSVFRGISNLPYQEYLPAFLIHLPNYPDVGVLPEGLQRLVLADYLFQPSSWTDHTHSSPIYLVNGYEGYRGYLDGIVAIYDQYVLNGEEFDWEVGDYVETYKLFKINTPINFLGKSAAPGNLMSVAILKEIKRR